MEKSSLWLIAAMAAVVAALVTTVVVPLVARLARALRAVDEPDARKGHAGVIPRLGGVAVGVGMLFGAAVPMARHWDAWVGGVPRGEIVSFLVATTIVFLVGLADDLGGVSPLKKLAGEVVAATILVQAGWSFEFFWLPWIGEVNFGLASGVVSVLWLVGVTNAVNLLDGLDGLASGVVAIVAGSLLVFCTWAGNAGSVALLAAMVGACIGFLRHNWEPARIFLGDSGSLLLGFLLAAFSVHLSLKAEAAVALLVPLLALGLPVIDSLLVALWRLAERSERTLLGRLVRVFEPDRQHVHHLLEPIVFQRRRIVVVLYATAGAFCIMATIVSLRGEPELGLGLFALQVGVVVAMRTLGLARIARQQAERQRAEVRGKLER